MNEHELERKLIATLSEAPGDYTSGEGIDVEEVREVQTFEEAGLLTRDCGLVVTMTDGSEFQITIVCSKRARD